MAANAAPLSSLQHLSSYHAATLAPLTVNSSLGQIHIGGLPFHLKGVTWRGTEGALMAPDGLRFHTVDHYLAFLQAHGFNALRLPFDHDRVLKNSILQDSGALEHAPELIGLPYTHVLREVAKTAARRGILVVLACERLTAGASPGQPGSGMWYNGEVSEELTLRSWTRLAHVACEQWNVIGVDLLHEPYRASWGLGDPNTDWNLAAERIGNRVLELCPRWLVFVQGVGQEPGAGPEQDVAGGVFWGENLAGARKHPVRLVDPSRLVYAPVTFGPSTFAFNV